MADNANPAATQSAAPEHGKADVITDLLASVRQTPQQAVISPTVEHAAEPGIVTELLGLVTGHPLDHDSPTNVQVAEEKKEISWVEKIGKKDGGSGDQSNLEKARILPIEQREIENERDGPGRGR